MKEYLLVLRGNPKEWEAHSPEAIQVIMEKYHRWVDSLRQKGLFKSGTPLEGSSRKLERQSEGTTVVAGPYAESHEALTGLFTLVCESFDHACDIAASCPALDHGETVEVIPAAAES